jgi:type IV secretory pathway component VirB8
MSEIFPKILVIDDDTRLRNLLTKYLEKRENYDFRKINLTKLNNRLSYIKNNSSDREYKNFQGFLSKDNPESPIVYYGKDFQRVVNVESVSFKRNQQDNLLDKAIDFIPNKIPSEADIRYTITNKVNSKNTETKRYLTRINFKFSGIDAKNKAKSKLSFTVISYKTYKIK